MGLSGFLPNPQFWVWLLNFSTSACYSIYLLYSLYHLLPALPSCMSPLIFLGRSKHFRTAGVLSSAARFGSEWNVTNITNKITYNTPHLWQPRIRGLVVTPRHLSPTPARWRVDILSEWQGSQWAQINRLLEPRVPLVRRTRFVFGQAILNSDSWGSPLSSRVGRWVSCDQHHAHSN